MPAHRIQVRPTPTSISNIGVGVIVEDSMTGALSYRFVDKPQTLLSGYSDSDFTARLIKDLDRWLTKASDTPISLEIDERFVTAGLLETMVRRWNNLVTVNHKQYVPADSVQDAVDLLFQKLISHGESVNRDNRVTQVCRLVRFAYESKESLRELMVKRPLLTIDNDLGERFDLGVIRDTTVYELNEAFSMHSNDRRQTENRIQAWTWKMSTLRLSGARLTLPNGDSFEIDNQTPIVATLWPPETKEEQKLLSTMNHRWDELRIDYVDVNDIESHAEKLSHFAA